MDYANIEKQITLEEFQKGRVIYTRCREEHIPANKAAALCYRQGRIAGKRDAQDHRGKELGRLHRIANYLKEQCGEHRTNAEILEQLNAETNSQPEAMKEGETTNE